MIDVTRPDRRPQGREPGERQEVTSRGKSRPVSGDAFAPGDRGERTAWPLVPARQAGRGAGLGWSLPGQRGYPLTAQGKELRRLDRAATLVHADFPGTFPQGRQSLDRQGDGDAAAQSLDRKSTRLNS